MRNLLRRVVNQTLNTCGYQVQRLHQPVRALASVAFSTVIDGGANVGEYSRDIRNRYPEALIFAFEPVPEIFDRLKRNLAGDEKTECYNQALGAAPGRAEFQVFADGFSSSLLAQTDWSGNQKPVRTIVVEVTTLDEWARDKLVRRPALLKLDLEGCELAALRGGRQILNSIDFIELETTFPKIREGQPTLRELINFLHDYQFELMDVFPGIMDAQSGLSNWADVLFGKSAVVAATSRGGAPGRVCS